MNHCLNMRRFFVFLIVFGLGITGILRAEVYNPPERIRVVHADEDPVQRTLRYQPENGDFVIQNGRESFNRPLYGGNTAFRVDAGDLPEFSFYLPRHGGVVRFGMKTEQGAKWLLEAESIVSRYRPGSMVYEIDDPLLEGSQLRLTVIGLYTSEGLIAKAEIAGGKSVELIVAYGGIGGRKGKRSGDIGCESEPVSRFFQLKPEYCKDNNISINNQSFTIESRFANFAGVLPEETKLLIADSHQWDSLEKLAASAGQETDLPVVMAVTRLAVKKPVYFALQRYRETPVSLEADQLSELFDSSEKQRRQIAEKVRVETPDPFINSAVSALCVAADAIWDESQGSVMHGAVAWRSKYLGWRGPYANDAFGWHDRSKRHLTYWAGCQNTEPVPGAISPADPTANLSRNEPSLHSNGDMSGKHYDMNLVYMDALFRHILWTGDRELAKSVWPVIERHLAWERRLFRRTFGDDSLPLYEAYAAIWASDDLQYHDGGVTHASAYNYYHNHMAARLAKLLGEDASLYEKEADLILQGMRKYLWLTDRGWYGEWKDLLGRQAVHPSAALWTFYHTIDSQAASPMEAWQMTRFMDTQIAHIPVFGGDIKEGAYFTLPTSNWTPYTWSTNNVVMAEVAHTALACWQAGRADKAYSLLKGCLLDSMYMGTCPGNAGMTSFFDMARGEAQRDFGDAVGICSRAIVEGLFGIKPDVLAGELEIRPGFPDDWKFAKLRHPDVTFDYQRTGRTEIFSIKPMFERPQALRLRIKARGIEADVSTAGGVFFQWQSAKDAVGDPHIEINCKPASNYKVKVVWKKEYPPNVSFASVVAQQTILEPDFDGAFLHAVSDPQSAVSDLDKQPYSLKAKASGTLGHRTVFARLERGRMRWWQPITFEIRDPYEIIASVQQDADSIRFRIRNNTTHPINQKAVIDSNLQSKKIDLQIPPHTLSEEITLSAEDFQLLPGSNRVTVQMGSEKSVEGIVTNWKVEMENRPTKWETVNLNPAFNDQVTQIFKNQYLSPRSPYCSLAIPMQGIGSWCNFAKTFEVDDTGLRLAAESNDGIFKLPHGVPFRTSGKSESKNIVLTSQWDNYPEKVSIALKGKASHLYLLMAGSTNSMQSRFDNGQVIVTYTDGSSERLALRNPTTWWPIDQDYFIDDYAFCRSGPIPPRVYLKSGQVKVFDHHDFKRKGKTVPGGAATVLDMPLAPAKELRSLTVQAQANEVVIGLMSATLVR